jgi:hypothetical protein
MRGFRRRRPAPAAAVEHPGGTGQILAGPSGPASDPQAAMRRIAAEAVILQDEAEAVIRGARAREGLGFLAPRGGPLVRRFFGLRDLLPRACDDPVDEERRRQLDAMNGGRRRSVGSWMLWTGLAPRPFSSTSSTPSSLDGRLTTTPRRSGANPHLLGQCPVMSLDVECAPGAAASR